MGHSLGSMGGMLIDRLNAANPAFREGWAQLRSILRSLTFRSPTPSSARSTATVTDANLNYEGSITIDQELLDKAGMAEYELVQVANINNGARFETYIISGDPGSGRIELNGAAARLAHLGDKVIIMAYDLVEDSHLDDWKPTVVLVNEKNEVKEIIC